MLRHASSLYLPLCLCRTRVWIELCSLERHRTCTDSPLGTAYPHPQGLPDICRRPPNGVAFSGGGSRGYVAALAQLGALHALGLMESTRTVTAVSGGAWAASVFTCYGTSTSLTEQSDTVPRDDDELFATAHAWAPQAQSAAHLAAVPPRAARGAVCRGALIDQVLAELQAGQPPAAAWRTALHRVIFQPAGIAADDVWTYDDATAADVASRCGVPPQALGFTTTRQTQSRPYLVIGITLLGPASLVPHRPLRLRSYTLLEASPLCTGVSRSLNVRYTSAPALPGQPPRRIARHVGGWVENWAFGTTPLLAPPGPAAHTPSPTKAAHASPGQLIRVAVPLTGGDSNTPQAPPASSTMRPMSLVTAAAASSYAPGGLLASQLPGRRLARQLGCCVSYFSPAAAATAAAAGAAATHSAASCSDMLLADGGCLTNPAIHPLLQRGATRLVCFVNYQTPLAPRAVWDPTQRLPTGADISEELPSLFGCVLDTSAWCFQRNAVFPLSDLARVGVALQDAAAGGTGAVVTLRHVTVKNAWFGIPAGLEVTVTWCYLHACPAWAAALPPDVAARLADANDTELGPLFPHFGTLDLSLTPTQVNLLHSLCTWTVMQHANQFRGALGAAASHAGHGDGGNGKAGAHTRGAGHVHQRPDKAGAANLGARSRVASAGRLAARALAATLLGARRRSRGGADGALAQDTEPGAKDADGAEGEAVVASSSRAREALSAAFATLKGVLPLQ